MAKRFMCLLAACTLLQASCVFAGNRSLTCKATGAMARVIAAMRDSGTPRSEAKSDTLISVNRFMVKERAAFGTPAKRREVRRFFLQMVDRVYDWPSVSPDRAGAIETEECEKTDANHPNPPDSP